MALLGGRKYFLGLDLGSYAVKAVEVRRDRGGLFVSGYAYEPVMDSSRYPDVVRAAVKSGGLRAECVSVAVGGRGTLVDSFALAPGMNLREEIAKRTGKIAAEAGDDILYDCAVLPSEADGAGWAVLAAARRSELEPKLSALAEAGLVPAMADSELVALANAFAVANAGGFFQPEDAAAGILDFGAGKTQMAFVDPARTLFREYPVGGDALSEMVAARFGVGLDEAEAMKCRPGENLEILKDVVHSGLEELAAEIRRTMERFMKNGGKRPEAMYMSGGLAAFPGAAEALSHLLRCRVRPFDAFGRTPADMYDAEFLRAYAHVFPLAFGLACRLAASGGTNRTESP